MSPPYRQDNPAPYFPIDCNYYDLIEATIVLGRETEVAWFDEDNTLQDVRTRLINLYAKDGVEYLELATGNRIRLDRLYRLDGQIRPGSDRAPGCQAQGKHK